MKYIYAFILFIISGCGYNSEQARIIIEKENAFSDKCVDKVISKIEGIRTNERLDYAKIIFTDGTYVL